MKNPYLCCSSRNSEQADEGKKALLLCKVLFSIPHPPTTIIFRPICKHKTGPLEKAKPPARLQKPAVAAFLQKLHVDAADPRKEVTIQYRVRLVQYIDRTILTSCIQIMCPIGIFNIDAPPMVKLSKPSKRKRASFSSLLIRSNTIASFFNRTKSQSSSTTFLGSNGAELTPCNGPQEDWVVHLVPRNAFEKYVRSLDVGQPSLDQEFLYKTSKNAGALLTPSTTPSSMCNKFTDLQEPDLSQLLLGFTYPANFYVEGPAEDEKVGSFGIQGREGPVLHYGDIVVLKNLSTGFVTCPFILRRVERTGWCIVEGDYLSLGSDSDIGSSASYPGFRGGEYIPAGASFGRQTYRHPPTYLKKDAQRNTNIPISPLHRVAFEFALKPMHFLCLNTGRKVQSPTVGISSAVNSFISQSSAEELGESAAMRKGTPHLYGKMCIRAAPPNMLQYRSVYDPARCDGRRPKIASSPYHLPQVEQAAPAQQKGRSRGSVFFDVDVGEACVWTVISIIRKECTFLLKKSSEIDYPAGALDSGLRDSLPSIFTRIPEIKQPSAQVDCPSSAVGQIPFGLAFERHEHEPHIGFQRDQYAPAWPGCPKHALQARPAAKPNPPLEIPRRAEGSVRTVTLDPVPEIYSVSLFPPAADQAPDKGKIVVVAFGKNLLGTYLFFGTQNTDDISVSSEGNITRCTIPARSFSDSPNVPILIARSDGLVFKSRWKWNAKDGTVYPVSTEDFVISPS